MQEKYGNKWSQMKKMLPGRTETAIKNRYNAFLKRFKMCDSPSFSEGESPARSEEMAQPYSQIKARRLAKKFQKLSKKYSY